MIGLLLMMTSVAFSQNTTRQVKNTTLVKIMKDLERCDSLQVAYDKKSVILDKLIDTNLAVFGELEKEKAKQIKIQKEVDKLNNDILKESRKGKNGFVYGIGGIIIGMVAVLSIN